MRERERAREGGRVAIEGTGREEEHVPLRLETLTEEESMFSLFSIFSKLNGCYCTTGKKGSFIQDSLFAYSGKERLHRSSRRNLKLRSRLKDNSSALLYEPVLISMTVEELFLVV